MLTTLAALAEPNRLRILEFLKGGASPVTGITEALGLPQPLVSRHLRVLRDAGLVHVRPKSRLRVYAVRPEPLRKVQQWLATFG